METASTRGDRPKLREALGKLQGGDTLVIYKPDRVARSMKELLVLLEDQLHARGIKLHILAGICAGIHRPDGATTGEAVAAITRITSGNFRLTGRLIAQIQRILDINHLSVVTSQVVEAARESLVIGVM